MKIIGFIGLIFLFSIPAFAGSNSLSSVTENCSNNRADSFETGKYNRFLAYLEEKTEQKEEKRKRIKGQPTGKQ